MIVKDFNLKHTIECGQFFRYKKENDFYYIQTKDKIIKIKQKNNQLISNESEEFLINFFNLNQDYQEILIILNKYKDIKQLTKQFHGLRIINQDPWECMISYISSSARSIPLIKQSIDLMSKQFEAFPIDTWIKKYLKQTNLDYQQFYPYQGYAQEFIYYSMIRSKFV